MVGSGSTLTARRPFVSNARRIDDSAPSSHSSEGACEARSQAGAAGPQPIVRPEVGHLWRACPQQCAHQVGAVPAENDNVLFVLDRAEGCRAGRPKALEVAVEGWAARDEARPPHGCASAWETAPGKCNARTGMCRVSWRAGRSAPAHIISIGVVVAAYRIGVGELDFVDHARAALGDGIR